MQIFKYLSFVSFLGMVTIFPKTYSLADTPGATNYVDPSGYSLSWPSSWTVYTVEWK